MRESGGGEADSKQARREEREEKVGRALLLLFFGSLCTSIALQQTFLGLGLAWAAYACWRKKALPRTPLELPILVFAGALLVSTLVCPDPLTSLAGYRKLWLVGAFYVASTLVEDQGLGIRLLRLTTIVATLIAAYGIVQHYTGIDLARQLVGKPADLDPFWLGDKTGFRTEGLFPSGITYAHNLLFPLSFVTAFLFAPSLTWSKRIVVAISWGLMVFALLFSLTRGIWLAYACVLVGWGLIRGPRALVGAACALFVCGLFVFSAGTGVRERAGEVFDLGAAANIARSQIWRANLDMIQERPVFGWGYGNYKQFRAPYYARYPQADTDAHAHNVYLQIWVDSGLLGLGAFVFLFGTILRRGWRIYCALSSEPLKSWALGILLSVAGFLVGGLTQHNFGDAEVSIVLWASVGVLLKIPDWEKSQKANSKTQKAKV